MTQPLDIPQPLTQDKRMDLTDVVTTAEVADRFKVTRAAVSLWVAEGKLTPVQRIGRAMVFDRADVERLAEERAA